jgi:hypothetical protein
MPSDGTIGGLVGKIDVLRIAAIISELFTIKAHS